MKFRKLSTLFLVINSLPFIAFSQDILPVPPINNNLLFYIQRSTNANTIIYELHYSANALDTLNPVHPSWILYAHKGEKEELDHIQQKYAYGIKSTKIADNHYELKFVSNEKYEMDLMQGTDNRMHVYTTINSRKAVLTRIYLKINGGTFWKPNIEYAEITGIDPSDNSIVTERLKI